MNKGIMGGIAEVFEPLRYRFFNRTGATVAKGVPLMSDILKSATETTEFDNASEAGVLGNLIVPTQTLVNQGTMLVLPEESIADDELGWCLICGANVDINVTDDAAATTNARAGAEVSMVIANSAVSVEGAASGARVLGQLYEDAHATVTGLKKGIWWGGCLGAGWRI